jgi:hypothetical protein
MAHLAPTAHWGFYQHPTARSASPLALRRRRIAPVIVAGWLLIVAGWLGVAMTMPGSASGTATATVAQPAPAPAPAPAPLVRFVPD